MDAEYKIFKFYLLERYLDRSKTKVNLEMCPSPDTYLVGLYCKIWQSALYCINTYNLTISLFSKTLLFLDLNRLKYDYVFVL